MLKTETHGGKTVEFTAEHVELEKRVVKILLSRRPKKDGTVAGMRMRTLLDKLGMTPPQGKRMGEWDDAARKIAFVARHSDSIEQGGGFYAHGLDTVYRGLPPEEVEARERMRNRKKQAQDDLDEFFRKAEGVLPADGKSGKRYAYKGVGFSPFERVGGCRAFLSSPTTSFTYNAADAYELYDVIKAFAAFEAVVAGYKK